VSSKTGAVINPRDESDEAPSPALSLKEHAENEDQGEDPDDPGNLLSHLALNIQVFLSPPIPESYFSASTPSINRVDAPLPVAD